MDIDKRREECDGQDNLNPLNNTVGCPTLLQGMSHEVRTHMNTIVALTFLINRNDCDEKEREEFSNQVLRSCEQLIGLFDNFLDSAILETGNSESNIRVLNINNMFDDLFSEFRVLFNKECNKNLTLIVDENISENKYVHIDSDRIFRVIRNLLQNALMNTRSGYIKLGYYFRDNNLTFYVIDSGQGYSKCKEFLNTEDLNDSLSHYNDTISAINLILARKLITVLGGNIWIESNEISGSAIYFSMPVKFTDRADPRINRYINSMMTT